MKTLLEIIKNSTFVPEKITQFTLLYTLIQNKGNSNLTYSQVFYEVFCQIFYIIFLLNYNNKIINTLVNNIFYMNINILTLEDLQLFTNQLEQKIYERLKHDQNTNKQHQTPNEFLTARETENLLKISATTLHDWSNKGILKKHRIGGRIRFKYDELTSAMTRMESKSKRV